MDKAYLKEGEDNRMLGLMLDFTQAISLNTLKSILIVYKKDVHVNG